MVKCGGCGKFMSLLEGVRCPGCSIVTHRGCVGLPDDAQILDTWMCPGCKIKTQPKTRDAGTPVRSAATDYIINPKSKTVFPVPAKTDMLIDIASDACGGGGDAAEGEDTDVISEVRLLRAELRATRAEVQSFRMEFANVIASVNLCDQRIDGLETRIENLERRLGEREGSSLEASVAQLKAELNDRDQQLLANDIDLVGIPEDKGEGLIHIVMSAANRIGVSLSESDIVSAERVGLARPPMERAAAGEDLTTARPRPIAVRLARRVLKEQMVRGARVRRGLTTAGMDLPGKDRPFYINERLTRTNRQLFLKARELGSRQGWKYIWTRDGRVYARREKGAEGYRLRSETDFERVFRTVAHSPNPKNN